MPSGARYLASVAPDIIYGTTLARGSCRRSVVAMSAKSGVSWRVSRGGGSSVTSYSNSSLPPAAGPCGHPPPQLAQECLGVKAGERAAINRRLGHAGDHVGLEARPHAGRRGGVVEHRKEERIEFVGLEF